MRILRNATALVLAAVLTNAESIFFFNNVTGATQWDRPASMPFTDPTGRAYWLAGSTASWLPADPKDAWTAVYSSAEPYFVNLVTEATTWERPECLGWSARSSTSHFWYNTVSRATQRERPAVLGHDDEERNATYYVKDGQTTWEPPENAAWREVRTPDDSKYYHNSVSDAVEWHPPADSNAAWIKWHDEVPEGSEF